MAKRRANMADNNSPPTTEPTVGQSFDTAMSMKMTNFFRDWLNRVADHDRSTAVQVMEKGAVLYAKSIGFEEPAPKRTGGR